MDSVQEMLMYYEVLYKKALKLSGNENDASDLLQETYLSTLMAHNNGLVIKNIKSYLFKVLKNKYINVYRKKNTNSNLDKLSVSLKNKESFCSVTAEKKENLVNAIRKELAYLPKKYREVIVQFYLEKKSVDEIANDQKISSSGVKNRLDRGRDKIREGVLKMEPLVVNSYNPDHLMLFADGTLGSNNEPLSVITNILEQNALILAYEKPISIKTISERLGIPTAFAEEAIEKLVFNEFMKNNGSKVYTNFPIIDDIFMMNVLKAQKDFVSKTFKETNIIILGLIDEFKKLHLFNSFNDVQLYLYALYTISIIIFEHLKDIYNLNTKVNYPDRPNGGKWLIIYGYKRNRIDNEIINLVYKFSQRFFLSNSNELYMKIFDTYLSPSMLRNDKNVKLQEIGELLFSITKKCNYNHLNQHLIPELLKLGFLHKNDAGKLKSVIPIFTNAEFEKINELTNVYAMQYVDILRDDLSDLIENNSIIYPKQIHPVSFTIKLISLIGISLTYAQKASDEGIINIDENLKYPVSLIVKKS